MSTNVKVKIGKPAGLKQSFGFLFAKKGITKPDAGSARQKAFSLLKHYGYLETLEILIRLEYIFGIRIQWHTARKYRSEYEKNHVGYAHPIGNWKRFGGDNKRKQYIANGLQCHSVILHSEKEKQEKNTKAYTTPLTHALRIVLLDMWHGISRMDKERNKTV